MQPMVLLESKNGNIVSIPKKDSVNDSTDVSEFSAYAMDFERHDSPAVLKYAQWFFIEFVKDEFVETVFTHLVGLLCDVVGVCVVRPGQCCAVARRTKVRQVMKFLDYLASSPSSC